jgi:hypothetical protein
MKRHAKRIIYDIVGMFLIILSPFLGAIPGPGGLIVFFAGLSILAVHNDWAKNLLVWARKNVSSLLDIVFTENKNVQIAHDCIGIVALISAIISILMLKPPLLYILPTMLTAMGLFWLLYNRKRYKKLLYKR